MKAALSSQMDTSAYLAKDPFKAYLRSRIYIEYTEGVDLPAPSLLRMYLASFTHRICIFSQSLNPTLFGIKVQEGFAYTLECVQS